MARMCSASRIDCIPAEMSFRSAKSLSISSLCPLLTACKESAFACKALYFCELSTQLPRKAMENKLTAKKINVLIVFCFDVLFYA